MELKYPIPAGQEVARVGRKLGGSHACERRVNVEKQVCGQQNPSPNDDGREPGHHEQDCDPGVRRVSWVALSFRQPALHEDVEPAEQSGQDHGLAVGGALARREELRCGCGPATVFLLRPVFTSAMVLNTSGARPFPADT